MMLFDLFSGTEQPRQWREEVGDGVVVLRGFAIDHAEELLNSLESIIQQAPLRHVITPGGYQMSVAMTNCGEVGWVSDQQGYRYEAIDPITHHPWPAMPALFSELANKAAADAGFADFKPDACLVNRYAIGAKMALHQDKDEEDFSQPIVSISLGVPATFLFGGEHRTSKTQKVKLTHGDVIVWGGKARLHFHGIAPLKFDDHPLTGPSRFNLTFRRAR